MLKAIEFAKEPEQASNHGERREFPDVYINNIDELEHANDPDDCSRTGLVFEVPVYAKNSGDKSKLSTVRELLTPEFEEGVTDIVDDKILAIMEEKYKERHHSADKPRTQMTETDSKCCSHCNQQISGHR